MADFQVLVENLRTNFNSGITATKEYRTQQLKNLIRLLQEGENELAAALKDDLGKPSAEAVNFEIDLTKTATKTTLASFEKWGKDEFVEKNLVTLLDTTYIHRDPLGVCLIIGPWNYPAQLTLIPLAGAIASGNCVVIKPSELAPATAKTIENLVKKYLDPATIQVVNGGIPETSALLKVKFDHIFFTGGTNVGKIVAEAASKHLTPCTLELGGKCPLYMDDTVDLRLAVKRLIWGKMINLGQTCVAPDYILCSSKLQEKLVPMLKVVLEEYFGKDPENSPDLCRIVSDRHYQRLVSMIQNTKSDIAIGGKRIDDQRFMDLHVLTNVSVDDVVMKEEIFGPILPIVNVESVNEAISVIKDGAKPLSMYIFSEKKDKVKQLIEGTSSGSVCVNDVVVQLSVDTLPFGGVGDSGYGNYHGRYTYDTFSHKKSVLVRNFNFLGEKLGEFRYPPYTPSTIKTARLLMSVTELPTIPMFLKYLTCVVLGAGIPIAIKAIAKANGEELPDWL